ncbi:sensor histidine kinase [Spirillospora sp. CA-294931]|uniref:sensor histidine kinase n=1 Tax=Spirillospora sp. CA-294931 TaxID=3240042 RepID=UPI003D93D8F5
MRRWRRWTLRSRLALAATALTASGLLVANGIGLVLLRSYLVERVDQRLDQMTSRSRQATAARLRTWPPGMEERRGAALDDTGVRLYLYTPGTSEPVLFPSNAPGPGPRLPDPAGREGRRFDVPDRGSGAGWRLKVVVTPDGSHLVAAASLESVEETYTRMLVIDLVVLAVVLVLLSLLAGLVVRIGLRPLSRMEATAAEIAAGEYGRRVRDVDPHTEAGRLGLAINTMLGRVESEINARKESERRLRRFLADASHELRNPLTSVRGFAELAGRGEGGPDALARIEAEASRMSVLVDELLQLARLDEQRPVARRPVDLLAVAAELVSDLHARRPDRPVRLSGLDEARPLFEPVIVAGDEPRLRQVLANLLDNAVRYTPAEASITLRVGSAAPEALPPAVTAVGGDPEPGMPVAVAEVADTGPGVAAEHAPHVFERLYRAERAADGGTGLGLAIAAAIVQAHSGRLELAATPGGGATFRMSLPIPRSL